MQGSNIVESPYLEVNEIIFQNESQAKKWVDNEKKERYFLKRINNYCEIYNKFGKFQKFEIV